MLALFVVLVGVLLISGYRAYRFTHHAVTVDAVILDSDVGCLFASGMPSATGGAITYRVRFPITGGSHITDVTRPCDVIPPDFGRGRGAIWVQYDVGDPDRVRVLNDHTDEVRTQVSAFMLAAYAVAALTLLALRRRRRTGASRSDRGRPADTA